MNTRLGKSFGLAFVVAVGILAVMFALGTFNAQKAGAEVRDTPKPTAVLDNTIPGAKDVTLTITFELSEPVDGTGTGAVVVIAIPDSIVTVGYDDEDVTVTQNGSSVGSVTVEGNMITIGQPDEDGVRVEDDVTTIVTLSGLDLAGDAATGPVTIVQTTEGIRTLSLSIYDPEDAIGGQSAELDKTEVNEKGVTMTLKFTTPDGAMAVTITLPEEYQAHDGTNGLVDILVDSLATDAVTIADKTDDGTGDTVTVTAEAITADKELVLQLGPDTLDSADDTATSVGFTNPKDKGTFTVKFAQGDVIPARDATFGVVPPLEASVESSTDKADTATRLTIVAPGETLGKIGPGDDIVINLKDFDLPSSISTSDVNIDDGTSTANPSEVTISGDNVTLVLGKFTNEDPTDKDQTAGNSHPANVIDNGDSKVTITIRERAGIKTPTKFGMYSVKVDGKDATDTEVYDIPGETDATKVTIVRSVSATPKSAVRGTEITITGKGFTDGGSTVKAGTELIGTPTIENGSFELIVNNDIKVGDVSAFVKGADGTTIAAEDGTGSGSRTTTNHAIKAAFAISPESPNPGQDITITLMDTDVESGSTVEVGFAGGTAAVANDAGDDKDTTWKITVPSDVRTGTIQISVDVDEADEDDVLTKNVTIATNALEVTPSNVVQGQRITVTGSGFTPSDKSSTTIEENTIAEDSVTIGGIEGEHDKLLIDNNGGISFNINIPDDTPAGSQPLVVTDLGGRIGNATLTVAKPAITLDPTEGLIGSDLTVSGTGFPANDLVRIEYNGRVQTSASTGPEGSFEKSISVPSDKGVNPGGTYDVAAVSQIIAGKSDTAKHKTPKAVITLSPTSATAGSTMRVSGENFAGFTQVTKIEISGRNATPTPAPVTDTWGAVSVSNVVVPQLTPGRYAVRVTVGDDMATEFLEIVATPVVTTMTSEEAFADLVAADNLIVVWYFDNDTKGWSFYDPRPEVAAAVDLTMVNTGDNVWIQITADQMFQGEMRTAGWNLVTLN